VAITAMLGGQWGDEGKGKVALRLSQSFDISARFQGGPNAGHSAYVNGTKINFRVVPVGMAAAAIGVIGNGCVINPALLLDEVEALATVIPDILERLKISLRAHLILTSHLQRDRGDLARKIGTTGNGIGPTYEDKYKRAGLRVGDALEPSIRERLNPADQEVMERFVEVFGPCCTDTSQFLRQALDRGQKVLAEGAQGVLLDIDHGDYPFVTSSNTSVGGVLTGLGVGPKDVDSVLLVVAAYLNKTGSGAFPSRLSGPVADYLRQRGSEVGSATQGAPDYGWLDLTLLKQAATMNQADGLIVTKLDILTGLSEPKMVFSDGQAVVEEIGLPGWIEDVSAVQTFADLPAEAQAYIHRIEAESGVPVIGISVGPYNHQYISRQL
jgi:adenylosuccinate synthase